MIQKLGLIAVVMAALGTVGHAQDARFRTHRSVEFRLAEDEGGPGLIAVHVYGQARIVYVHPEVQLDDRDIRSAVVVTDANGEPAIQLRLRTSGIKKFNAFAEAHRHKTVAICANDKVLSAPVIEGAMVDELLDITGTFTKAEAVSLAKALSK